MVESARIRTGNGLRTAGPMPTPLLSDSRSAQAFACLPNVCSMGMMPLDPIWRNKWHRSWCAEFHYVLNGRLSFRMDAGRRVIGTTSELLLLPTGARHRDEYDLADFPRVFMLFFSWKAEGFFWRLFPGADRAALRVPISREITGLFERIQTTLAAGAPTDELLIRTYVLAVLLLIARGRMRVGERRALLAESTVRRRQAILLKAKQYLEQHYREHVTLIGMAESLGVSPYTLSHVFSREHEFSLFAYLTSLRMRQARLLLQQGARSVKEAAQSVGYDDTSYFSKAFHRYFGIPPRVLLGAPYAHKNPRRPTPQ